VNRRGRWLRPGRGGDDQKTPSCGLQSLGLLPRCNRSQRSARPQRAVTMIMLDRAGLDHHTFGEPPAVDRSASPPVAATLPHTRTLLMRLDDHQRRMCVMRNHDGHSATPTAVTSRRTAARTGHSGSARPAHCSIPTATDRAGTAVRSGPRVRMGPRGVPSPTRCAAASSTNAAAGEDRTAAPTPLRRIGHGTRRQDRTRWRTSYLLASSE
jgi:hypothetical protein